MTSLLAQGNEERQLLDNLTKKYNNIVLGLNRLKQMQTETTHAHATNTTTTASLSLDARQKFLKAIRNAIAKLADGICKSTSIGSEIDGKWRKGSLKKTFVEALNMATQLDAQAAMEVFKVQIMLMVRLANACELIPWRTVLEEREWVDALKCSTTFAQLVFYTHRLRFYQTRPPVAVEGV